MDTRTTLASLALLLSTMSACNCDGAVADDTAPAVRSTFPDDGAVDIATNAIISVTFSEKMAADTISNATFTVSAGAAQIDGVVDPDGVNASFTPTSPLPLGATVTATLTTKVEDLSGDPLEKAYVWTFTTKATADTEPPTVLSTNPIDGAVGVAIDRDVSVTFSEGMDPASLTTATFTIEDDNAASVAGAVMFQGEQATFNPSLDLTPDTAYIVTITTGARDLANNPLALAYQWTFTTGAEGDLVAPTVVSTDPVDGAQDVGLNRSIVITFSEALDPSTLGASSFTVQDPSNVAIDGNLTYSGTQATFTPLAALEPTTIYQAAVTTALTDLAGNALATGFGWSFTTGNAPDTQAPTVLSTGPIDTATDVPNNRSIVANFSEAMAPATLTTGTFTLTGPEPGLVAVTGSVTCAGTQATFRPAAPLDTNTQYRAAISTDLTDLAGNSLLAEFAWSFTTSTDVPLGPAPVLLGRAGLFVILAKSGIDTVPTSAVTGDIGVSPIDSTAVTGFSLSVDASNQFATSSQITGRVFAADYTSPTPADLTTAVSDMETAYTDAAGRPTPDHTELGAGEIGGLTLTPGLYKWGTGVAISTDVTLAGGPNDVWIFQIAGDVTQASGVRVNLSGGALPKNIFWQTFGQYRLSTTAHAEGIVLCQTAVILETGASINGRLLAQTAVTIDQSIVVQPAP